MYIYICKCIHIYIYIYTRTTRTLPIYMYNTIHILHIYTYNIYIHICIFMYKTHANTHVVYLLYDFFFMCVQVWCTTPKMTSVPPRVCSTSLMMAFLSLATRRCTHAHTRTHTHTNLYHIYMYTQCVGMRINT